MTTNRCTSVLSKGVAIALFLLVALMSLAANPGEPDQKVDRDNPRARGEWFLRGRQTANGKSGAEMLQRALQRKQQILLEQQRRELQSAAQGGGGSIALLGPISWTSLGPAPITGMGNIGNATGRVTAVEVDPNDTTGNTVYVGGAYGGVWKSTNATNTPASVTWTPMFDTTAPTLTVGAIAVQPNQATASSRVVLVGTGEPNNAGDSYYGLGILRSADGGATWNTGSIISQTSDATPTSFRGIGFSKFAWSTSNNQIVIAGGAQTPFGNLLNLSGLSGAHSDIYYSADAGATWKTATFTDSTQPARVTDVVYDSVKDRFFAFIAYHGVYESTDGTGSTWTRLATQPSSVLTLASCPNASTNTTCPAYRGQFAVRSGTGDLFVIFVNINDTDEGVYKANFSGTSVTSWTAFTTTSMDGCGDSGGGCGTSQGFYDLYIAAVPNSTNTDLYVGAVNLFKCTTNATTNTTCNAVGAWKNLTHVYGSCVNTYQSMHPDNHGISWNLTGGSAEGTVMFFGNDGGLYRSLNSFGLTQGSCTGTGNVGNTWDDLNDNIGSLTQFIAISQSATDSTTILGGTQDNGSPAIGPGQGLSGTQWFEAWGGDGGYNAIDPTATLTSGEWYVTNTDVTIWNCNFGTNCIAFQPFNSDIQNASGGGTANFPDSGNFYTPWILDPQNPAKIIIGTCRVWRGPSVADASWGASLFTNALSNKLIDGTSTGPCNGNDITNETVTALAAGGPTTAAGSKVIWVGTYNNPPLGSGTSGVYVNSNATTGIGTFTNVTGTINSGTVPFPISSIAVDPSDPTGQTAYVAIQGFTGNSNGAGHVWRTTNGGSSWTDVGVGNGLPDNPVNSIVIDPRSSSVIYLGTDVGVFASTDGGTTWGVYGTGLPNVAIFDMKAYNSGGVSQLRVGTHGRGVWSAPLASVSDYSVAVSNTPLILYRNTDLPGTLNGTLSATGSYSGTVNLSCTAGAPTTCTPSPSSGAPTSSTPVPFTVSVNNATDGAFSFNVEGNDGTTIHDAPVTVNIVNFALGGESPNPLTVPHGTTQTATFNATASGPFSDTVNLAVTACPVGFNCVLSQSTANPTSGTPVNGIQVNVTNTNTALPPGTYGPVTVEGSTASHANYSSVSFNINLTTNPSFTVTNAVSLGDQYAGTSPTTTFSLGFVDGYTAPVGGIAVTCSPSAAGPTCSDPTSPESSAGTKTLNLTAGTTGGQFTMTVTGNDGTNSHATTFLLPVLNYSVAVPGSATVVAPNTTTNIPVSYTAQYGGANGLTITASNCVVNGVAGASCALSANPTVASGGTANLNLQVTLPAASGLTAGSYNVTFDTSGSESGVAGSVAHNGNTVAITINPDFTIANTSGTQTVTAGQTAQYTIQVTAAPQPENTAVALTCSGLPSKSSCSSTPAAPGATSTNITLSIATTATTTARLAPPARPFGSSPVFAWLTGLGLPLFGVVLAGNKKARKRAHFWMLLMLAALAIAVFGCGGTGGGGGGGTIPGTPPGTYTITVTGTAGAASHSTTVTLTVQ